MIGFGPTIYDESVVLFDSWVVRLLSLSLIAAVLYHAFNGVRIMIIDFWRKGSRYQRLLFGIVLAVTIIVFIPIAYKVIAPVVPWFVQPVAKAFH